MLRRSARGQGTTLVVPRLILGPPLVMVLVYLWSRAFPAANINFMGVVTLQVPRRLCCCCPAWPARLCRYLTAQSLLCNVTYAGAGATCVCLSYLLGALGCVHPTLAHASHDVRLVIKDRKSLAAELCAHAWGQGYWHKRLHRHHGLHRCRLVANSVVTCGLSARMRGT